MSKNLMLIVLLVVLNGCGPKPKDSVESESAKPSPASARPGSENMPGGKEIAESPGGSSSPSKPSSSQNANGSGEKKLVDAKAMLADMHQMKSLALSIHNYHDAYRRLPMLAKGTDEAGVQLSWCVRVLPFLELLTEYDKFDTSQAWDSAQNKPLIDSPGREAFTLSNGHLVCAITHEKQPKRFAEIVDGLSNTVMLIENPGQKGDHWTQPVDLTVPAAVKMIKALKPGEFLFAVLYDGSVRKIYSPVGKNLSDDDLTSIFDYKDLKPVNQDVFE